MLSAGMFSALASLMALRRRGFLSGSPPDLAAMLISRMRRVKILPRLASRAPFLCLIVAHFEWPDMMNLVSMNAQGSPVGECKKCLKKMQANTNYSMVRAGRPPCSVLQFRTCCSSRGGKIMPKYVIEREIPGAGDLSVDQLQAISQK